MHKLPPVNHPARGMFDISDLVAIGTGAAQPATLPEAIHSARQTFAASKPGLVRRVMFIVRKADDALWMISVGPKGGWRKEWEFEPAYHRRGA